MNFDLSSLNQTMDGKLPGLLGIKITQLEKGSLQATMPVETKHHQPMGVLHGGASVSLAETVASIGAWYLLDDPKRVVVGQEINANHIRQIRQGLLRAEGKVIHQGKTTQVWEVKIFGPENKLICISRCTLAVIAPR